MAADDELWHALGFQVERTYQPEEIIAQVRAHRTFGLATGPETVAEGVVGLTLLHRQDNTPAGRIYFARADGATYRLHRPSQS